MSKLTLPMIYSNYGKPPRKSKLQPYYVFRTAEFEVPDFEASDLDVAFTFQNTSTDFLSQKCFLLNNKVYAETADFPRYDANKVDININDVRRTPEEILPYKYRNVKKQNDNIYTAAILKSQHIAPSGDGFDEGYQDAQKCINENVCIIDGKIYRSIPTPRIELVLRYNSNTITLNFTLGNEIAFPSLPILPPQQIHTLAAELKASLGFDISFADSYSDFYPTQINEKLPLNLEIFFNQAKALRRDLYLLESRFNTKNNRDHINNLKDHIETNNFEAAKNTLAQIKNDLTAEIKIYETGQANDHNDYYHSVEYIVKSIDLLNFLCDHYPEYYLPENLRPIKIGSFMP